MRAHSSGIDESAPSAAAAEGAALLVSSSSMEPLYLTAYRLVVACPILYGACTGVPQNLMGG
jgi:hypothetical protein